MNNYRSDVETLFYVLVVLTVDGWRFKVGITKKGVKARYAEEKANYIVLYTKMFPSQAEAKDWETWVKQSNEKYRYKGPSPFARTKATEIFGDLEPWVAGGENRLYLQTLI